MTLYDLVIMMTFSFNFGVFIGLNNYQSLLVIVTGGLYSLCATLILWRISSYILKRLYLKKLKYKIANGGDWAFKMVYLGLLLGNIFFAYIAMRLSRVLVF